MKNILLPLLTVLLSGTAASAQSEADIVPIRSEVQTIDKKLKTYRKTSLEIEGISLEGTKATYHLSGDTVKKIDALFYGETYDATGAFYYVDRALVFVYQTVTAYAGYAWKKPMPAVVSKREQRLYFRNGKLIRFLDGKEKTEVKKDDPNFGSTESETVETSGKLLDALKGK